MSEMKEIETEVLIIGSGAAGLRAAIAAHEAGVHVFLVSKMPLGRNNCTEFAAGGFFFAGRDVSIEEHFERTIQAGKHVNDHKLVRILCKESPQDVKNLTTFGVRLDFDRSHGATTAPFSPPLHGGAELTRSLVTHALQLGIKTQEWVMILSVLKNSDNQVIGAIGYHSKTGNLIHYHAKAIILATGGIGEFYTLNDNPTGITGDGYALAYDVGADLIDMEFVQFYPLGIAEPGHIKRLLGLEILDKCPVINNKGTEFLKKNMEEMGIKDGAEASLVFRDLGSRAVALEIYEGRGENNTVLMDLSQVSEEDWNQGYLQFVRTKLLRRFNFQQQMLHVAPIYHFMVGGVMINEQGATTIPGLFAAGEVTGGVHGANRHGGNALSETIVFGRRAGEAAALYAREHPSVKQSFDVSLDQIQTILQRIMKQKENHFTPMELKREIRKLNDQHLHIVRTEGGLKTLIDALNQLDIKTLFAPTPKKIIHAFEVFNLVLVSKLIAVSALSRQESRGTHYRHDYPHEKPTWLKNTVIRKRDHTTEVVYKIL